MPWPFGVTPGCVEASYATGAPMDAGNRNERGAHHLRSQHRQTTPQSSRMNLCIPEQVSDSVVYRPWLQALFPPPQS